MNDALDPNSAGTNNPGQPAVPPAAPVDPLSSQPRPGSVVSPTNVPEVVPAPVAPVAPVTAPPTPPPAGVAPTAAVPVTPITPAPPEGADAEADQETPETFGQKAFGFFTTGMVGIFNWLIVPAAIVLVLHFFVFQAFHVVGYSMIPTLDQSDYLIISKLDATLARAGKLVGQSGYYIPKRGEIIVFHYPKDPTLVFVKRVVGLPGEHVTVKAGKVTVYNSEHPNGFDPDTTHQVADPVTLGDIDEVVPKGNLFVLGDNRTPNGSFDSRDWGDLPSDMIIGKSVLRLLPLNKLRIFSPGS